MEIFILLILLFFNAFFSLSEIALVSSKLTRLDQYRMQGSKGASVAIELIGDSEKFLSAVQVGITLIGIITGAFSGVKLAGSVTPLLARIPLFETWAYEISLTTVIVLITYISIVIGELVPKSISLSQPEKVAIRVAPTIKFFTWLFYPIVKLLSSSTTFVTKMLGVKKQTETMTESELRQIIRVATAEGVIEEGQNEMHEKLFNFSDKKAKHLMTHRTEVEWIDLSETDEEIEEELFQFQHTKIVCCYESLDDVKGILIMRDFYKAKASGKPTKVKDLMIEPVVVYENTSATLILEELRIDKNHFCVVVDEYGDFEGIITLQDILENIVGYIADEDDEIEGPDVFIREDNSALVSGEAPIETLEEIIKDMEIDFEQIDYSTVAGFVMNLIGKIPKVGDITTYMDYKIEVVDMDGSRIDKVLINKMEEDKDESES